MFEVAAKWSGFLAWGTVTVEIASGSHKSICLFIWVCHGWHQWGAYLEVYTFLFFVGWRMFFIYFFYLQKLLSRIKRVHSLQSGNERKNIFSLRTVATWNCQPKLLQFLFIESSWICILAGSHFMCIHKCTVQHNTIFLKGQRALSLFLSLNQFHHFY